MSAPARPRPRIRRGRTSLASTRTLPAPPRHAAAVTAFHSWPDRAPGPVPARAAVAAVLCEWCDQSRVAAPGKPPACRCQR